MLAIQLYHRQIIISVSNVQEKIALLSFHVDIRGAIQIIVDVPNVMIGFVPNVLICVVFARYGCVINAKGNTNVSIVLVIVQRFDVFGMPNKDILTKIAMTILFVYCVVLVGNPRRLLMS